MVAVRHPVVARDQMKRAPVMRRDADRCGVATTRTFVPRAALAAALLCGAMGCARSPSMFRAAGPAAEQIARLGWLFTIVAAAVTVIVTGVLLAALYRRRPDRTSSVEPSGDPRGSVRWIIIGGVVLPVDLHLAGRGEIAPSPHGS